MLYSFRLNNIHEQIVKMHFHELLVNLLIRFNLKTKIGII